MLGPSEPHVPGSPSSPAERASRPPEDEDRYLRAMVQVEETILTANSVEELLRNVLDAMLDIFECDRAWLLYPCDPEANTFTVPMERTRSEWPGAGVLDRPLPMDPWSRANNALALATRRPCRWDPEVNPIAPGQQPYTQFHILSMMLTAVHPHVGKPWALGIHHCSAPRVYAPDERIFESIAARVGDGLSSLLAREALDQKRGQLERAQELAQMGSFEWQVSTNVLDCSQGLCRLLGLADPPSNLDALVAHFESTPHLNVRAILDEVSGGGVPTDVLLDVVRSNGEVRKVRLHARAEPRAGHGGTTLAGVLRDVTEHHKQLERERQLEEQLRQAQKMEAIGQLTGGVAHDFNNLLTVILGSFDLLLEPPAPSGREVRAELVQQGRFAAQRAAELTHRLLAFARKQALKPEVLNANDTLANLEVLLRRSLGEAVEIEIVKSAGLWNCDVDRAQLEQVILNLAINARDAMPRGGRLTIETGNVRVDPDYAELHPGVEPGQYVLIAVTDGGHGMSSEVAERAFDPFFTTKDVGKGSGLGLSMAYGFVKQSGGHIKIYSEIGQGTTVKVYLPRHYGNAAKVFTAPESNDMLGSGEVVLVVEDDERVRATTVALLDRLGYRSLPCADGPTALELLDTGVHVDLLFSDVVLPKGMNGVQLAEEVKRRMPQVGILFASGYTENAVIHHGRLDPGVLLLEKPFTRQALARSLKQALKAATQG